MKVISQVSQDNNCYHRTSIKSFHIGPFEQVTLRGKGWHYFTVENKNCNAKIQSRNFILRKQF